MSTYNYQKRFCLFALLSTTYFPFAAAQDRPTCYSTGGEPIKDPNIIPCNPSATASGEPGSHSSCCNQGTGDICLTTGLCLSLRAKVPSRMLWVNGCTDLTWRDPACPQYCNSPPGSSSDSPNPRLLVCTPTTWCCVGFYPNDEECCKHSFNMTARGLGKIERILVNPENGESVDSTTSSSSSTTSPTPSSSNDNTCKVPSEEESSNSNNTSTESKENESGSTNSSAAAITGGVLGTLLLGVSVALGLLFMQNRRLRRKLLSEKEQEKANGNDNNMGNEQDTTYKYHYHDHRQQQNFSSPAGMTAISEVADPHYGMSPPIWVPSELPVSEGRSQLES